MITPHTIRKNHATYGPTTHIVVDCESEVNETHTSIAGTTSEVHTLRCWTAQRIDFRKDQVRFIKTAEGKTPAQFWTWFREQIHPSRRTWMWAHNAHVDMTWLWLWKNLDAGHISYKHGVFSSPPLILHLAIGKCNFTVVDSLNWWRCPLSDLGTALQLPKLPMPARDAPVEDWLTYCRRDTEILSQTVQKLVQLVRRADLGMLRPTVGGQSHASWRHIHTKPFPLVHGDEELSKRERQAYYAGMALIGYQGCVRADTPPPAEKRAWEKDHGRTLWGTTVHCLDIRSFYPSVMRGRVYPYRVCAKLPPPKFDTARKLAEQNECIAWVKVCSKATLYPRRVEGKTSWATGTFWTQLAAEELRQAWRNGEVIQAGPLVVYEAADLFTTWVDRVWELRKKAREQGEGAWEQMLKVLANSLHGKLGQHSRKWTKNPEAPVRQRWGEWINANWKGESEGLFRAIAGTVEQKEPEGEHWDAFVSIPVCITANARALAREIMADLPPRSLLHHNTDSFHVTTKGYEALKAKGWIGQDALGDLRRDRVALSAEYVTPSTYRLEQDLVVAGIPRQRQTTDDWTWIYNLWEGIRNRLQRGPVSDVLVHQVESHIALEDHKVTTDRDGWVVSPHVDDDVVPF